MSETGRDRQRGRLADYGHRQTIPTRWEDNDVYGHVNNVVYYSFFDTIVNQYLLEAGVLDIEHGAVIGLVVETRCRYFAPVSFPTPVTAALRVAQIGRSSVHYEIGLFTPNSDEAAAEGRFVHVYVARDSRRPVPLPDPLRRAIERLVPRAA